MKELGKVIERCSKELKRPVNVNCRVESFGATISKFDEDKRKLVKEMGFAGLYAFVDRQLPGKLCYWLATRVDVNSRSIVTIDGKEFRFSLIQVHWVLGIPMGKKSVPKKATEEMSSMLDRVRSWYSRTTPSLVEGIPRQNLVEAVEGPLEDPSDFKIAFLLLAIVDILCPTTSHRLCPQFLPAAFVAEDAKSYDWCSLVIDQLMHAIGSFARRFYPMGFSKSCGGCTIFLAIFYLDRLKRTPIQWGVFPRMAVWTTQQISKAKKGDRHVNGDFGKLGTVKAAYGRAHEMNTEDVMPLKRPAVVMEEVYQSMFNAVHSQQECVDVVDELINIRCVKKRRYGYFKKKDLASGSGDAHVQPDLNVHAYAVDSPLMSGDVMDDNEHRNLQSPTAYELDFDLDLDRDTESQNDTDSHKRERERELYLLVELELGLEFQFAVDLVIEVEREMELGMVLMLELAYEFELEIQLLKKCESDRMYGMELEFELGMEFERERQEVVAYEQQRVGDLDLLLCSVPKPLQSPEKIKLEIGYSSEEDGRERGFSPQRSRRKRKNSDSPLLPEGFRDNPVLLSVDGIQVTLHMCAGIAAERGQVFDAYVSAASKLYEKVWAARYADRSKRFMLDPMFAMRVFQRREMVINTRVFTPQMDGVRPKRINVVFVPVLFEGHWWCVAFSVNREEILVIDSIQTSSASEVYSANVDHLAYAMDLVFQSLDPKWEVGTVTA